MLQNRRKALVASNFFAAAKVLFGHEARNVADYL
jgi:hypothetical protein